jgi:PAS domain S-box-containing protein
MIAYTVADESRLTDRAVTTLTRTTNALLRATDELSLLDEVCRIAVELGGYRLAWIGYARNDAARTVEPMAHAGIGMERVRAVTISWGEGSFSSGPTGIAIRTGTPQVVRDAESNPAFDPWRAIIGPFEFRSAVSLPIGHGDEVIGALMMYADAPDAFDDDTVRLLADLAHNLSYGIRNLRAKAEHDQVVRDLAESEERYRSLIELTPDAILVHSVGTILFGNPASAQVFGAATATTLVGCPFIELVAHDYRAEIADRILNPPPGQCVTHYKMYRLDGSVFDAEVVASTIAFHGLTARLLVIRDITERLMVQQQLLQHAKLATLGEMAAGLVHELSQPLNIIRLTAEGALMFIERGKATQDWQTQQFALVADQAQRTAEIIDDIRIFSRRDSSPVQAFDAVQAVGAATSVLEGQFRPDGVTLLAHLPQSPQLVRGRRVQLEQVVMNLLTNAHHAVRDNRDKMPAGWHGEVLVSAEPQGSNLRVVVADNGPGIPAAMRQRIFEPFFTTKEAGRGTGLGLSVSFGIINSMGGRLEVEDRSVGACFVISLPIDAAATAAAAAATATATAEAVPPGAIATGDAHIMVVEDEVAAAEAIGNYLRELGCRVSFAANGDEAWALFKADPADVVITDLRMPAGDGEQLVEKLRDFDPLLPVIIVTGRLGETERLAANLEDDRCAVLKKPVALAKLAELVTAFLLPPSE